jgi:hypothetical protein
MFVRSAGAAQHAWRALRFSARELRLDVTLTNGQSFAWRPLVSAQQTDQKSDVKIDTNEMSKLDNGRKEGDLDAPLDPQWIGVISRAVVILKQTPTQTLWRCVNADSGDVDLKKMDDEVGNTVWRPE